MRPRAALSLDVDSLHCYRQIHGLAGKAEPERDPIYTRAMPRFFELIATAGVPATLFLIGADAPGHAATFRPAGPTGCEVANHSFSHDYRLSLLSPEEVASDLRRAHEALLPLAPAGRLAGFRAPGYNTSPAMLAAAANLGYRYDSSLLPSPPYYLARAAAIRLYSWRGRVSRSLPGRALAYMGPLNPYPVDFDRPWRRREGPLLELPVACEPLSRIPLIGSTWNLFPPRLAQALLSRALARLEFVNFELHALDLLDSSDPGVSSELAAAQPDLRIPAAHKLRRLACLLRQLQARAELVTLAAVAG